MMFGLKGELILKFREVFAKYPEIDQVLIYGSRAMGNYRAGSDIDLVLVGSKINDKTRSRVWIDLDDLNSPYLIDLAVFHQIKSEDLRSHINRVGKEFYSKAKEFTFSN
jgi:predicted nucleotidyltransferase